LLAATGAPQRKIQPRQWLEGEEGEDGRLGGMTGCGSDFGDASARGLSLPDPYGPSRFFEADVLKKQGGRWAFVSRATSGPATIGKWNPCSQAHFRQSGHWK
jgi:hypothetical protein